VRFIFSQKKVKRTSGKRIQENLMSLRFVHQSPGVDEYLKLRTAVGWRSLPEEVVRTGMQNSLFSVCVYEGEEVVGCGRVIGDGAIYVYIQDIIVQPEFQGRGIGLRIMEHIMDFIYSALPDEIFVGLMAAKDVADFYKKFGFMERPPGRPGMFTVIEKNPGQP
jgi:ribosomal protein S18 acetylase RimI-like enzyme